MNPKLRELNFGFFMSTMIGLTGGIGSGKSTVAKVFATLGIPVFNADEVATNLMQTSIQIKQKLIQQFGEQVYEHQVLNKTYLASIVFNDPYQLSILNSIVHPITIKAAWDWAATQTAPYVIKEAALIFESAAAEGLDFIIGVTAPVNIRIQRVMHRDHCSVEDVQKRMQNQISDTIKMKLCDAVIINDDVHLVVPQVIALHETILKSVASL